MRGNLVLFYPGLQVLLASRCVYFIACNQIHRANSIAGPAFDAGTLIIFAVALHLSFAGLLNPYT
jgi:hypothetical protein